MEACLQKGAEPMAAQEYREVRTKEQLNELLHYGHVIPFGHGYTQAYVAENYPGWTWNQLARVLSAAGVFVPRDGGRTPVCHDEAVRVHFDSDESWRVEWQDGTVTEGPLPPGSTSPEPALGVEVPVLDLRSGLMLEIGSED